MKSFEIYGIGNGIVDILIEISEAEFEALGFERGTMNLVDTAEQRKLLAKFADHHQVLASGGSVANSVIGFAQIGGSAAFSTSLGGDVYGRHYKDEFEKLGISLGTAAAGSQVHSGEETGTSVILITPDAERTMRTNLGISALVGAAHVDADIIKNSEWLFVEGYLFASPEHGQSAVRKAIALARSSGCKVAITFSAEFIVRAFGDALREAVESADLVFANEEEARAYTGKSELNEVCGALAQSCPHVALTAGPQGVYLAHDGEQLHVPAFECTPKDLTGAGDMFAGAYLYGLCSGENPQSAARTACYMAREVIIKVGARLQGDIKPVWEAGKRALN